MTQPRQAQLDLLLSISEGLSRGSYEMLRLSPTDAMHAPSCGLAIRDAVEELRWMRAENERLREALKPFAALFLWPDDAGDERKVNNIRSHEDWSDLKNDATLDDKWVYRGEIRAARNALEGKT